MTIIFTTAIFWAGLVGVRAMFDFELAVLFGIATVVAEQVIQRAERDKG